MTIVIDYDNDAIRMNDDNSSNIAIFRKTVWKLEDISDIIQEIFSRTALRSDQGVSLDKQSDGTVDNICNW